MITPERVCDIFHHELAFKSFPTMKEMNDWCLARLKQLRDPTYHEEQRKKRQLKKEDGRKSWEAE
jgi:hypothetical protein